MKNLKECQPCFSFSFSRSLSPFRVLRRFVCIIWNDFEVFKSREIKMYRPFGAKAKNTFFIDTIFINPVLHILL